MFTSLQTWGIVVDIVRQIIGLQLKMVDEAGQGPFFPRLCLSVLNGSSAPTELRSTDSPEFAVLVMYCEPSDPLWNNIKIRTDPGGLIQKHGLQELNLLKKRSVFPRS